MVINITSGTETEGMRIQQQLVDAISPGLPESQQVHAVRDLVWLQILFTYMLRTGASAAAATQFLQANIEDVH